MRTTRCAALVLLVGLLGACTGSSGVEVEEAAPTSAEDADEQSEPEAAASPEPAPDPAPETSAEPTPEASPEPPAREVLDFETAIVGERPADGWPLAEGTYTGAGLGGLSVDIPSGSLLRFVGDDGLIVLGHESFVAETDRVFLVPADGVVPPDEAGVHIPHGDDPLAFTVPVPDDLGTWFDAVAQAEVVDEGRGEAPLGGFGWWDVVLRPELGETFSDCGHPACIHHVVTEDGAYFQADSWTMRYAQTAAIPNVIVWSEELEGTGPAAEFVATLLASSTQAP